MTSTRSEDGDEDNATIWARVKAARVRLSSETDFYRNYGLPVGSQPQANTEEHQASSRDSEGEPPKVPTISASDEASEKQPETCPAESTANVPEIPTISASDESSEKKPAESEASVPELPTISASDESSEKKPETCPAESEASVPEIPTITTSDEISYKQPEPCFLHSEAEPNDIPTITAPDEESEKQPETCSAGSECLPSPPATVTFQDTLSVAGLDQIQSQPHEVGSPQVSATQESVALQSIPSTKIEDLEPQPASRMPDSDDSDVVMLRPRNQNSSSQNQENIRPTGTEPGKHKKTHSQRLNGRNGKRNVLSDKITDGPSNTPVEHISTAGNTGPEDLTSQPRSSYKVAPPEVQEELKKLQEEALAKAIERRFEVVLNSNPETLNVVREGPGTDPESEEFLKIAAFRTINVPGNRPESSNVLSRRFRFPQDVSEGERKKLQWSFYSRDTPAYPTFDKGGKFMISTQPTAESEERSALLASYDDGSSVGLKQPPQPPRDFPDEIWDGIPADWLFRPSYSETNTNLERYRQWFWRWLDSTVVLAYPVDIYHEAFFDGTAHTDGERGLFIPDIESHDTKIDMTDEETRLHYNETGAGYIINYRLHLLKEAEEKGARVRRERGVYLESCLNHEEPNPYVPKANIYLRPAENRDVPGLLELCNWYIHNTALCADLETLTRAEMIQRIADSKQEKLPFIVAVERNNRHALDHLERVLGYALATDYMGQTTAGRHTVELEVFVSHGSKRLGVARCLMDKLLQVCDPTYVPHLGYFFDSDLDDRPGYECGGRRMLARLIFTYCFSEDDKSEYERVKEWLKGEYSFYEQGLLRGVCVKFGKLHNVSYLVRNVANFTP
ncbi:hypothetical protein DTO280E4_7714 [Paecilomyces variotii]|nr:hypothetical protein DTO169C6_6327 [Paecilomyces variotii]KAJ9352592.1 hypothetical protein DTO280E4_7714 [Paecilomyces variotii]KAJ9382152.1 hypothetical protein DTO063F5_5851 [Paecilomyces variotii]